MVDKSSSTVPDIIVALDVPSAKAAMDLVDRLEGQARWVKVGLELYLAAGRPIVEALKMRGLEVFLDLKLHDIPNTVAGAVRSLAGTGASLLTVHAGGGAAMMRAAAEAASYSPDAPRLLAVTVLTSMNTRELAEVGVLDTPAGQVSRLAQLAWDSGMSGMICSAEELQKLRSSLGSKPLLVVPAIRPVGTSTNDQARVATPEVAVARGASMLVIGRPITQAADPAAVLAALIASLSAKVSNR